ncbi:MAG: hypothetical protein GQ532_11800 [Methylomarinum sp.]|nr:hypothetical protein [Methylomarinum sp.]
MSKIKYPVARSHPTIHACPQFRPIRRGARRKGLERIYTCGNGDKLTISLFWELDIADQDLLLCLLAIARAESRGVIIPVAPETISGKVLRVGLDLQGYAATQEALMISVSRFELLTELGRSSDSRSYLWLKNSLIRLSKVSFVRDSQTDKYFWTFNLLSVSSIAEQINIAINPLSARAVLGHQDGYVLQHRAERASLDSEEARALHSVLCGLVQPNTYKVINTDVISDRVYARYDDVITDRAQRGRRAAVKSAAAQINKLDGWACDSIGRGKDSSLSITRNYRDNRDKVSG